jgi:hypothetical protein
VSHLVGPSTDRGNAGDVINRAVQAGFLLPGSCPACCIVPDDGGYRDQAPEPCRYESEHVKARARQTAGNRRTHTPKTTRPVDGQSAHRYADQPRTDTPIQPHKYADPSALTRGNGTDNNWERTGTPASNPVSDLGDCCFCHTPIASIDDAVETQLKGRYWHRRCAPGAERSSPRDVSSSVTANPYLGGPVDG